MASQNGFPDVLEHLDFGPLTAEVESVSELPDQVDAVLRLRWDDPAERGNTLNKHRERANVQRNGHVERFETQFREGSSLRDVRNAALQLRDRSFRSPSEPQAHRLLVMPYLNRAALDILREMGVNALDLCGNGILQGDGWWFYQHGNPNRYSKQRSRALHRGKSALVGRALLLRPTYEAVGEVQEEIERRGASISLSQVSKVLSALEEDLIVRKRGHGIQLLQPKKLLDALAEGYQRPTPLQTLETKAELGPELFERLAARAATAGARIAGFEPQRYVIAPQSLERLEVYVEPRIGADLSAAFSLNPVARFSNLVIRVVDEPGVYFDLEEADGFRWCPPMEVYLQLMQEGKREKEIAGDLRGGLLSPTP